LKISSSPEKDLKAERIMDYLECNPQKKSSTKEFFADDKDTMKWRHDIEKSFKNKKVSS